MMRCIKEGKIMQVTLRKKLAQVVNLVDKQVQNPNVDLDYRIPGITITEKNSIATSEPYLLLTCTLNEEYTHTQRVPIKANDFNKTAQEISKLVISFVKEFTEQCACVHDDAY
ncbi:MAG: Unknown protein [uncultured Sulfurovum sp.]|uniref:Uncharacterized protein n=1 Tax=uncultured Sulfurovum sp. TaxID=269237 RepID=A0A6S6T3T4_9BACT|nr:MAG: Unknown protein [uncultured Sulfurovum sp.]